MLNVSDIRARAQALPGHISLLISDLATGEEAAWQPWLPIEAASVIKLFIMAEAFRQREAGAFDFAAPVTIRPENKKPSCGALTYLHDGLTVEAGDLVTLMIILSDNTATNLLIDMLGPENINGLIDALGLTGTRLNRRLFEPEKARQGIQNYTCAGDTARLMRLMLDGQVVSPRASREMLEILGNQRLNGKMPFYLHARGIRCAHKTGEDDGITHDVGVIWRAAAKPCIFCFLSEETDVPRAERQLQELALTAALNA